MPDLSATPTAMPQTGSDLGDLASSGATTTAGVGKPVEPPTAAPSVAPVQGPPKPSDIQYKEPIGPQKPSVTSSQPALPTKPKTVKTGDGFAAPPGSALEKKVAAMSMQATYSVKNPHPLITNPASYSVSNSDHKSAFDAASSVPTTGIITDTTASNAMDAASEIAGNAQNNPLPSPQDAGLAIDPSTDPESILKGQLKEQAAIIADPTKDAAYTALQSAQKQLDAAASAEKQDIQNQADQQYQIQQQTNKESLARMEVAMAESGLTGSPTAVQYANDLIAQNTQALNSIRQAENSAIVKLNTAIAQDEVQIAMEQAQLIDQNRTKYVELATQTFQIQQQKQDAQMKLDSFKQNTALKNQQLESNGMKLASDRLALFAKSNVNADAIPQAAWDQFSKQNPGVSPEMAKAIYKGSQADQMAATVDKFNANTQAFYQAASQLAPGTNSVLYRPNPDGSFSKINVDAGNILTEKGQDYKLIYSTDDPNAPPMKIPLGATKASSTLKEDAFGNTIAVTQNEDGSWNEEKILDFAGNPAGKESLVSTTSHLDSTGLTYAKIGGNPAWAPEDGSVHFRGEQPATECGEYVNDILGTHFGDSLDSKIKVCDPSIGTAENPVSPGDAIVTSEAAGTGHVAIIDSIYTDSSGQTVYSLSESNYKKNAQGQGIVTNGRTIRSDDPNIKGFARGSKNPASETRYGAQTPTDNGMAWKVDAPLGTDVTSAIKNGTVMDMKEVGQFKDGSPMYMAQIKDNMTGMVTNYSGLSSSELRVGSSWDESQGSPVIGKSGDGGYAVDLRNNDGSPIQPKGQATVSISQQVANGLSWGDPQYASFDPSSFPPIIDNKFKGIVSELSKGIIGLDSALNKMKNNKILGQIPPEVYFSQLQDAANMGNQVRTKNQLTADRLQQSTKLMENRNINATLQQWGYAKDPTIQAYLTAAPIMDRLKAAQDQAGPVSDQDVLDAMTTIDTMGGRPTEQQIQTITGGMSWQDTADVLAKKAGAGGVVSDQVKQNMIDLATNVFKNYEKGYQQRTAYYNQKLQERGFQPVLLDITQAMDSNQAINNPNDPSNPQNQTDPLSSIQTGGTVNDPVLGDIQFTD